MKRILPGLYTLTNLTLGRAYLIEDPDGLTLIDVSMPASAPKILRQIEGMGRKPTDVKRILITHAHFDHHGNLPLLKQATRAQIFASALEKPTIEGKQSVPRPDPAQLTGIWKTIRIPESSLPPVAVDRVVEDGDVIETFGGLQAVFTPGHAPGHMAYWQAEKRVLFCGDVIMRMTGLTLPFAMATVDMHQNKKSVQRLAQLNPEIVCFGHGNPLTQNTTQTLRTFAQKHLP
ncbi:MAG TPA: MBL fold metallo-hydrolase [Anaerolineales bacterium]|nr:MBL fold metallo-hydrolase [Anaerolineales bacterium]